MKTTNHKCSTSWCDERVQTAGDSCERCQHELAKFHAQNRAKQELAERRAEIREAIKEAATIRRVDRRVSEVARLVGLLEAAK